MNFLTNILTVAERIAADRAKSQATAALAGNAGESAPPLSRRSRTTGYQAQNQSWALTPRQRRRVEHKANLAAKRARAGGGCVVAAAAEAAPAAPRGPEAPLTSPPLRLI